MDVRLHGHSLSSIDEGEWCEEVVMGRSTAAWATPSSFRQSSDACAIESAVLPAATMVDAQRAPGLLNECPRTFLEALQKADVALSDACTLVARVLAPCPITGAPPRERFAYHTGLVELGCVWTQRPPMFVRRCLHRFAIASSFQEDAGSPTVGRGAIAALICDGPPTGDAERLLDRLETLTGGLEGTGVLLFLFLASALGASGTQQIRHALLYLVADAAATGAVSGASLSATPLFGTRTVPPSGPVLRGERGWTAGDAQTPLTWRAFCEAADMLEARVSGECGLVPNVGPASATLHHSALAMDTDTPIMVALMASAEGLGVPAASRRKAAERWREPFASARIATVGDARAMPGRAWQALTRDLPRGVGGQLTRLGVGAGLEPTPVGVARRLRFAVAVDPVMVVVVVLLLLGGLAESVWITRRAMRYAAYPLLGWSLVVAKICAAWIRVLAVGLFLPVCDQLLTWAGRGMGRWFARPSRTHMMWLHRKGGAAIALFGAIHTAAHLVNGAKIAGASAEARAAALAPGTALASLDYDSVWDILFRSWIGISGVALCLVMGLISVTSVPWVRRVAFEGFFAAHQTALAFPLLVAAHPTTLRTAYFVVPGFAVYLVSRVLTLAYTQQVQDAHVSVIGGVVHVSLPRTPHFRRWQSLGDWVRLSIPSLDGWLRQQWHPLSIASSPLMSRLELYVKPVGSVRSWSRRLLACADTSAEPLRCPSMSSTLSESRSSDDTESRCQEPPTQCLGPVLLHGPIIADPIAFFEYPRMVLIGSGIGVTPIAAVLTDILYRMQIGATIPLRALHFWWVARDQEAFLWLMRVLEALEREYCQCTSLLSLDLDIKLFVTRETAAMPFQVVHGRPHFVRLLEGVGGTGSGRDVGVVCSGNAQLAQSVWEAVRHHNRQQLPDGPVFHFSQEMCFTTTTSK